MYQIEWFNNYVITNKTEFQEWCALEFDYQREGYFNFLANTRPIYIID